MRWLVAVAAVAATLCGCSRDRHALRCEPNDRYERAASAIPVRVPDDLTPPDETDALELPSADAGGGAGAEKPCLESPPKFTPGNPAGRGRPTPPAQPPPPPPPGGADREIDN